MMGTHPITVTRGESTHSVAPRGGLIEHPRGHAEESRARMVSTLFNPDRWTPVEGFAFQDITYHRAKAHGTVRIAFNRPEVRNAFRPRTVDELYTALDHARQWSDVGCVLLTGNGPSPKDGGWAFCSGGDQRIRGADGYKYEVDGGGAPDPARLGRLHILEVQRLIRFMPKVVIAVVPGWAVGGGHSLHVVCDMTLASKEHAIFKQTDADVASFDGGYGSAYLAKMVGQKRAREIFFLGRNYGADEALAMGMVNASVPHAELEETALDWAREINSKSHTAIRMLKFAFNLCDDGLVGQQLFAGEATRLAYGTDEAKEGRDAFLEKRARDFSKFPWHY
jgi:naphthoate synthase